MAKTTNLKYQDSTIGTDTAGGTFAIPNAPVMPVVPPVAPKMAAGVQNLQMATPMATPMMGQPQVPATPNIPVAQISGAQPLDLKSTVVPIENPVDFAAGLKPGQDVINDYIKTLTPDKTTALQQKNSAIMQRIESLIPQQTGRGAMQLQAEKDNMLPEQRRQLSSLNTEIMSKAAEFDSMIANQEGQGRGIPASIVSGRQASLMRSKAAAVGVLQARALGLSGQLEASQALADRSVSLLYADREAEFDSWIKQAELIAPQLDKEEAIQLEARKSYMADQKAVLEEKKAKQKINLGYGIENNVQTPFYTRGGAVIRTSDGFEFSTPEEAFAAGVSQDFSNAPEITPIAEQQRQFENEFAVDKFGYQVESDNRNFDFEKEKFNTNYAFEREKFISNYNLDLDKFNFDQQQALIENESEPDKPLSTEDLIKFGGLPAGTTWGDVKGAGLSPEKPPSDSQLKVATFADRLKQASDAFASVENDIAKMGGISYWIQRKSPNWGGKGSSVQVQEQAERNFLNAVLRQESGASIAPTEFDNGKKQYFPQPGDSAEVLKQKKQNRDTVLSGMQREAGSAIKQTKSLNDLEGSLQGNINEKGGLTTRFSTKFKPGSVGGQCGTFAHKLVNFPSVGDAISQKYSTVDRVGLKRTDWINKGVRVGDVIISNESKTYGHVAVVNRILPNGQIQLSESNYAKPNMVTHNRVVAINSPKIYGAIRGTPIV